MVLKNLHFLKFVFKGVRYVPCGACLYLKHETERCFACFYFLQILLPFVIFMFTKYKLILHSQQHSYFILINFLAVQKFVIFKI